MSLADLGNLGEFIASVAVLVTLVYLAIQIRQNTAAVRVQVRQAISEAQFANINSRATDERLPLIIMKLNRGEALTTEEHDRLYFHTDATMRQFENVHSHSQAGVVSEKDWSAMLAGMVKTMRTPISREIWSNLKLTYNEDFRSAVDAALQNEYGESG